MRTQNYPRLTLIIVITVEATPQSVRPRSQSGRPRSAGKPSPPHLITHHSYF